MMSSSSWMRSGLKSVGPTMMPPRTVRRRRRPRRRRAPRARRSRSSGRRRPGRSPAGASLEALVEVDPVRGRVEGAARLDVAGRVVLDHRRRRTSSAKAERRSRDGRARTGLGDGRSDDLRRRQVGAALPPGRNSVTGRRPGRPARRRPSRRSRSGRRGSRPTSRSIRPDGVLHGEAVRPDGRDHAGNVGDDPPAEW